MMEKKILLIKMTTIISTFIMLLGWLFYFINFENVYTSYYENIK